nr:MAG TPA: hypothetical protein [Caudoviricetes sp.]
MKVPPGPEGERSEEQLRPGGLPPMSGKERTI